MPDKEAPMPDKEAPMPDKEAPMSDTEIAALKAAGDLGLDELDVDRVTAKVSAVLEQEYQAESGRSGSPQSAGKWQRRRRLVIAAFVALVVGGGAAVGYATLTGSSTASDGIGCYAGDEIGGSVTVVGLDGRRATKTCGKLWAAREVVAGTDKAPAPLHACVSGDGGGPISVLASTDAAICDRVGLVEDPDAGIDPDARRYGEFESELMAILEREDFACIGSERMRQLVERHLEKHELQGWTIGESANFDRVNRCATLALDSDTHTITMFAVRP